MAGIYLYLSPNLPDVETLRDVRLQTPMRVYTREGDLIGQFGEQKRTPLPFDEIPPAFIEALLAAEDEPHATQAPDHVPGHAQIMSQYSGYSKGVSREHMLRNTAFVQQAPQ